ncbi:hypothetical protein [Longimicrobium sp.]|uniref:hypothetical protein n=1 Tax=Longimicrobium sp. TaxID=2029185 RepID=UPI002BF4E7EC|nr:hypothetical protein [Longimicrobium sp.]HSU14480.1 hypothetical protein [Longimicrobium sp.]
MKTARFLLACAAVSVLAACGSQTITAPVEPPARPHADEAACVKVTVLNPDGTTTEVCASTNNSGMMGSGS